METTQPTDVQIMSAGIVYCSCVDWESHWERMHQFAWMLSGAGPVLYVDNPGVRPLRWDHFPRIARRLLSRFHSSRSTALPTHGERLTPNLHFLAPILIPSPRDAISMAINRRWLRGQVARSLAGSGMQPDILWVSTPADAAVSLIDAFPWRKVVYDCVDDLPALHPARAKQLKAGEDRLFARADIVLVTSKALQEKAFQHGWNDAHYIPNGIEMSRFEGEQPIPSELEGLPRPVIGFVGSMLKNVFDLDLLISLAEARPEWSLVLVGPMDPLFAARAQNSPLHLIDRVDYHAVPAYIRAFDVALIPFLQNAITRAINPLKVYEYLACGLPVVSSPLPELDSFGDLIIQAAGLEDFIEAIEQALSEGQLFLLVYLNLGRWIFGCPFSPVADARRGILD